MGVTSAKVKNAWTTKNYDRITFVVKKGEKERIKAAAEAAGESVSRFIVDCINQTSPGMLSVLDDESKRGGKQDA